MPTLGEWLFKSGEKPAEFSRRSGVHPSIICRVLNDGIFPRKPNREKIVSATGGEVSESDLLADRVNQPEAMSQ